MSLLFKRSAAVVDGSEKRNGWLNLELQSPHAIERHSEMGMEVACLSLVPTRPLLKACYVIVTSYFSLIAARRGRSPPSFANQQRRTVFDRLDPGPLRGRGTLQGGGPRDQRMIEIEVNPQDVPRGKRYFMVCISLRNEDIPCR